MEKNILNPGVYFVSGIDTDAGKSYATAYLARAISAENKRVVTQKFVQTGCTDLISEDIITHRRLMGIDLLEEDIDGTTCPEIFAFPASAHLAAALEDRELDLERICASTATLASRFEIVLVEGAGGLMVPLKGFYLTIDYIAEKQLPVILVTSPRLGSINHTLLSLEACSRRGIKVEMLIYNHYPRTNRTIHDSTLLYMKEYLAEFMPETHIFEVPIF